MDTVLSYVPVTNNRAGLFAFHTYFRPNYRYTQLTEWSRTDFSKLLETRKEYRLFGRKFKLYCPTENGFYSSHSPLLQAPYPKPYEIASFSSSSMEYAIFIFLHKNPLSHKLPAIIHCR